MKAEVTFDIKGMGQVDEVTKGRNFPDFERRHSFLACFCLPVSVRPPKPDRTSENFDFLVAHSRRYYDGPYGPSCTPTLLCCALKKIQMSHEVRYFGLLDQVAKCRTKKRQKNKNRVTI